MKIIKKAVTALHNISRTLIKKPTIINLNIIATNQCNQSCSMCNSSLSRTNKNPFTHDLFNKYVEKLKPYQIVSCTISGGEPTLIPELPDILEESVRYFPFGVHLITNLYGNDNQINNSIETALKNNINISISFDGFGEIADRLRGAKNVSCRVDKNLTLLAQMKKEMNSKSSITLHTVLSDVNLAQIPKLFEYSKNFGFNHSIAPVNQFYYQDNYDLPKLSFTQDLINVLELALSEEHVQSVNESYIKGIALYSQGSIRKVCPYLKPYLKTFKIFLNAEGELSLCDRASIGNINTMSIEEMLQSTKYQKSLKEFHDCDGCWMGCFVEPELRMNSSFNKEINKLYQLAKDQAKQTVSNHIDYAGIY